MVTVSGTEWDAIVVGAGAAGLASAAMLDICGEPAAASSAPGPMPSPRRASLG